MPTRNHVDRIEIRGKIYKISAVDAANPVFFLRAKDPELTGTETLGR